MGSGKGGRVTKGDLLAALASGVALPPMKHVESTPAAASTPVATAAAAQSPATATAAAAAPRPASSPVVTTEAPFSEAKASTMRKVIAKRLTQSKATVPHLYVSVECELDAILAFRKALAKEHEVKVSVNDLIIRSAALALRDVPELNASYDPALGRARLNPSVDVSVAVATPGGLITPIVTNADKRRLVDITETVRRRSMGLGGWVGGEREVLGVAPVRLHLLNSPHRQTWPCAANEFTGWPYFS